MPQSDYLSDFELIVMLAVAGLGDDAYGVTIATHIDDRTGRDVSIGAVYATLGRLADKGYVKFSLSDPDPVPGGRSRKLVTLTTPGVRVLRHTTASLTRMMEGVRLRPLLDNNR